MLSVGLAILQTPKRTAAGRGAHDRLVRRKLTNDLCLIAYNDITLDQVLQLPDVSRPAVFQHATDGVVAERGRLLAVELAVLPLEVLQKYQNLFPAFAQWGDVNGDHVQAVEEIFAE